MCVKFWINCSLLNSSEWIPLRDFLKLTIYNKQQHKKNDQTWYDVNTLQIFSFMFAKTNGKLDKMWEILSLNVSKYNCCLLHIHHYKCTRCSFASLLAKCRFFLFMILRFSFSCAHTYYEVRRWRKRIKHFAQTRPCVIVFW